MADLDACPAKLEDDDQGGVVGELGELSGVLVAADAVDEDEWKCERRANGA